MEVLQEQGHRLSGQALADGLATVQWPCRLEVLVGGEGGPLVVADGAHNPHSAQRLAEALPECFHYDECTLVFGASQDKDLEGIVRALAPVASQAVVTGTRHPRSASPALLAGLFEKHGVRAHCKSQTSEAVALALQLSGDNALVLATGSLFLAAEAREVVKGIPPEIYPELSGV